ncbi:DUF6886 family protein [Kribbella solani]|uniref:DUF6886 family protein n=1 Tax=Kribbella solani TaxID=236067 RepID=UPI0038D3CB44
MAPQPLRPGPVHRRLTTLRTAPRLGCTACDRAPDYWFPRQCPRTMAWVGPSTTPETATDASTLEWGRIRLRNARP